MLGSVNSRENAREKNKEENRRKEKVKKNFKNRFRINKLFLYGMSNSLTYLSFFT